MLTESEIQEILLEERIVELENDIRLLSRRKVKEHFASDSGRIVLTRLLKSIIWQAYQSIQNGTESSVVGNLRTFWYRFAKVVVSRIPKRQTGKTDPYDIMTRLFSEMILDRKLFKYRDFGFADENWENRRIGKERPDVLVFAEKSGWIRYLRQVHEELGVSVLALGGFPSALTSEYTCDGIKEFLADGQSVRLVGIVDYDFSGADIATSFRDQLERAGLPIHSLETIIQPKYYSSEELAMFRYKLPRRQKTKLEQWLEETGGIDGKAFGLESESMPLDRLHDLVKSVIEND